MGGDYYDREVISTTSNTGYSQETAQLMENKQVHKSLSPLRWTDENLQSEYRNPIVFALDVTGSMGDWAKIIYEKMPMFYGQIMMQGYLKEPAISFCAIGDHKTEDETPMQFSEFGQGKGIDQLISKMVLWKSGGGNEHESYELAAYFYENHVDLINPEMAFFFVTGDEGFWDVIEGSTVQRIFGKGTKNEFTPSSEVWAKLMQKFNVFHIHKPYTSANYEKKIHEQWINLLGAERVLDIVTPKACVDVILGAVALTSGRTLDEYISDMKSRGQDSNRIQEVVRALQRYSQKISTGEIIPVKFSGNPLDNKINTSSKIEVDTGKSGGNDLGGKIFEINPDDLVDLLERYDKLLIEDLDEDGIQYRDNLKKLKLVKGNETPKEFICPLTNEITYDPVMTCDGLTFERKAIEVWLEKHDVSPVTGLKLDTKNLLPNFALKQLIKDYYQSSSV